MNESDTIIVLKLPQKKSSNYISLKIECFTEGRFTSKQNALTVYRLSFFVFFYYNFFSTFIKRNIEPRGKL